MTMESLSVATMEPNITESFQDSTSDKKNNGE